MKLVVVESPAKAKTIERFLGPDFKVAASYGHIRDLPASAAEIPEEIRSEVWARLAVDVDNGFKPVYVIPKGSKKHIAELKKLLTKAKELWLATDEDREGESISWHLLEVLKPKIPVKRIAFHEITKSAIAKALEEPRAVNTQLVRAQESRRILDRLFGYSLSPVLWKKVRTKLSAGRVQSVALRLIVEREEERQAFRSAEYWDIAATLSKDGQQFTARLFTIDDARLAGGKDFDPSTGKLKQGAKVVVLKQREAEALAAVCVGALPWRVVSVEQKEARQRPSPPFTTSTMQQAAGNAFGFSPKETMVLAQRLYEGVNLGNGEREGLITYMRTDSLTLSEKALVEAGQFITRHYGTEYYTGKRVYKTKSKMAQEAHEAIRPTDFRRTPDAMAKFLDERELKLYRLIWSRALASQMADAVLDKTTVDIEAKDADRTMIFRATGSVVRFAGYLRAYGEVDKDTVLPALAQGEEVSKATEEASLRLVEINPERHTTAPPPRYTEASLVKKLEEEGIGRPSTYAPTIGTIQQRDYVVKRKGALVPTFVGMAVVHLLRTHFAQYVDLKFTARMEEALDEIATGDADWIEFLDKFYHGNGESGEGLLRQIEKKLPEIEYPAISIGTDPDSGEEIKVRIGRSTAFVQRGEGGDGNTATIPMDVLIDELTPEKALEILQTKNRGKEPLGTDPASGENVYLLTGPFGPYVQLGESNGDTKPKRTSLPKGLSPGDVDLKMALKLLSLPRVVGTDPATGKKVHAGLGRYGPFVERGGTYRRLDSFEQIFTVTLEQATAKLAAAKRQSKEIVKELGPHPDSGKEIQVAIGRYGPYVTDGVTNAKLPDLIESKSVTMDEAVALLEEAAAKKSVRKPAGKRSTKGKSASPRTKRKSTKAKSSPKTPAGTSRRTSPRRAGAPARTSSRQPVNTRRRANAT